MYSLLSVGLDVGTTTTQMVLSRLAVENRASAFAVPEMHIAEKDILYKSPVLFTPLLSGELMDGEKLRQMIAEQYRKAGIRREQVDTGAIIITGETSRKENAAAVLAALSDFAGEFVVAAAGPELESVLAAKGSGAEAYSEETGRSVLHMDIGGGTSNLAWLQNGEVKAAWCMNVGGRLIRVEEEKVTYVSPVLLPLTDLRPGQYAEEEKIAGIARMLAEGLEMAAGLREKTDLMEKLATKEAGALPDSPPQPEVISFSGGVADCIGNRLPSFCYGDIGPVLGRAISESRLCRGKYVLGRETIRATVIGAGCHSAQLSGSTVYSRGVDLPLKNLPVVSLTKEEQEQEASFLRAASRMEDGGVLALPGYSAASYEQVAALADRILSAFPGGEIRVVLQADMAKALGQTMALKTGGSRPILCLDRLELRAGDYLDVGVPVGPALPVVIKTLILGDDRKRGII